MKFRKKPVVIEAFCGGSERFYPEWLHDAVTANIVITHATPNSDGWGEAFDNCDITTLEGVMHAQRGDWIIRGVKGELYPCKPDIFALTYEAANSPAIPSLTDADIDVIGLSSNIEAFQNKEFRMRRNQNMTHSERADYDAEIDFVRRIEKKVRGEG